MQGLSFFSGAMGMDIGLEQAGINIILACENDKAAQATIKRNRPDIPLIGDLMDYSAKKILDRAGVKKQSIDLIVGGPPCQAFSTAGKRKGFADARGNVFLRFLALATDIRPPVIIIENVRGLLSAVSDNKFGLTSERFALYHVIKVLKDSSYSVSFNLYNTANFGTPQIRERLVIVCQLNSSPAPFLVPTHHEHGDFGLLKWRTFRQAVEKLETNKQNFIPFPERRLKFYKLLKAGQNWRHLPESVQKKALGRAFFSGGGKTGFFRRLAWDKPAPTLVTHPAMPATDLAHPEENRPLSVEEYKTIQQFPDNWIICGSLLEQYRQIGNAVPCGLGEAVGKLIVGVFQGKKIEPIENFRYSRYINTDHMSWEVNALSKKKINLNAKQRRNSNKGQKIIK